jgi:hypothetical protein
MTLTGIEEGHSVYKTLQKRLQTILKALTQRVAMFAGQQITKLSKTFRTVG